ncbi:MAG: sugar ABC transporter substrate-binding protein [Clostridia bacterium]|nr:sugar ABC transporter substrate-binding protein [Clostridia bacterium]
MRKCLKKTAALLMASSLCSALVSCKDTNVPETSVTEEDYCCEIGTFAGNDFEPEKLTMFIASQGESIYEENDIRDIIADKTDVYLEEEWLPEGQDSGDYIKSIIESDELPDLINGGDSMNLLYDANVLVPWDDYIEKYPNLKELYTEEEWDMFRQDDGHIYWANVFCNTYGEYRTIDHQGMAFWIQARVLEWDNYPVIETLDEYFDLLERYYEANPTMPDGIGIIPYTVLCDDWRYFCIESAPLYLDGYYPWGSVIVNEDDPSSPYVIDYNTTSTAQAYFRKLNEEYLKGIIDPEFADQTYEEYIAKLRTGCVLGMCDEFWDFNYQVGPSFIENGLSDLGCDYVPLGLSLEKGQPTQYIVYGDTINYLSGVAVTTSCENPDIAFKFLSDVLYQDIHDLRFWGEEGTDYLVDDEGHYYRTEEMRENWEDPNYQLSHCCQYSYLPQWLGTSRDGMNAMQPQEQPKEFYATISKPLADCFKAYGAGGYADMLNADKEYRQPEWAMLYEYSSSVSDADIVCQEISNCKHEWLPQLVVSMNFDATWKSYMNAYEACNPQVFLDDVQDMLDRRMEIILNE